MKAEQKSTKTSTALPFQSDLDAVAIGLAEISKQNMRPHPWPLILRRCHFYPPELRIAALNYVARKVASLCLMSSETKRKTKAPDPFAVSKRLHNPALRHMPYQKFLAGEYWMAFRAEKIKQAGGVCSSCNATDNLHVHHLRYNNRGYECYRPKDTVVLCSVCHAQRHKTA